MPGDREERNRVFGVPIGPAPGARREPAGRAGREPQREPAARPGREPLREPAARPRRESQRESQRVLGFHVDWFGPGHQDVLDALRHPVRGFRRWRQRRAEGP